MIPSLLKTAALAVLHKADIHNMNAQYFEHIINQRKKEEEYLSEKIYVSFFPFVPVTSAFFPISEIQ